MWSFCARCPRVSASSFACQHGLSGVLSDVLPQRAVKETCSLTRPLNQMPCIRDPSATIKVVPGATPGGTWIISCCFVYGLTTVTVMPG